jgi:hypothetical protein
MAELPIVARCRKCGREFVRINPKSDLIDRYLPHGMSRQERLAKGNQKCGGTIELLETANPAASLPESPEA